MFSGATVVPLPPYLLDRHGGGDRRFFLELPNIFSLCKDFHKTEAKPCAKKRCCSVAGIALLLSRVATVVGMYSMWLRQSMPFCRPNWWWRLLGCKGLWVAKLGCFAVSFLWNTCMYFPRKPNITTETCWLEDTDLLLNWSVSGMYLFILFFAFGLHPWFLFVFGLHPWKLTAGIEPKHHPILKGTSSEPIPPCLGSKIQKHMNSSQFFFSFFFFKKGKVFRPGGWQLDSPHPFSESDSDFSSMADFTAKLEGLPSFNGSLGCQ